jgi:5-methylthioadenosine/S-adenosylhomocysteine deaminase
VSEAFVEDGSLVAMAEMLRAGVTCVNDMYFFPEATARAALKAGMRACLGIIVIEFPSAYAATPQEYLDKGLAMRERFAGEALLSFCMAPHAPYTVADETMKRIVALADRHDMPIHTHVHETAHEVEDGVKQHGVRPFERLRQLGLVGRRLIAVHAVHMNDAEMDVMAREGVSMAHCPSSNLKLASGFAPVAAMRARGIPVGFGTDGAASNNRLDLMTEMRTGALLAKAVANDASVIGAYEALEMATLQPARALGLQGRIGSIEPGKSADLAAVDLGRVETRPGFDAASDLVYAAGREHVTDVWVGGEARVRDGRLMTLDAEALADRANHWQRKLA